MTTAPEETQNAFVLVCGGRGDDSDVVDAAAVTVGPAVTVTGSMTWYEYDPDAAAVTLRCRAVTE